MIAKFLGYSNEVLLLEDMLCYLVAQWLVEGSIENFPFVLFSFSNRNDFFKLVTWCVSMSPLSLFFSSLF